MLIRAHDLITNAALKNSLFKRKPQLTPFPLANHKPVKVIITIMHHHDKRTVRKKRKDVYSVCNLASQEHIQEEKKSMTVYGPDCMPHTRHVRHITRLSARSFFFSLAALSTENYCHAHTIQSSVKYAMFCYTLCWSCAHQSWVFCVQFCFFTWVELDWVSGPAGLTVSQRDEWFFDGDYDCLMILWHGIHVITGSFIWLYNLFCSICCVNKMAKQWSWRWRRRDSVVWHL